MAILTAATTVSFSVGATEANSSIPGNPFIGERLSEEYSRVPTISAVISKNEPEPERSNTTAANRKMNQTASDFGNIVVKHALIIDGIENNMFVEFEDPQQAMSTLKEKIPTLLSALQEKYTLPTIDQTNWKEYDNALNQYSNESLHQNEETYGLIQNEIQTFRSFVDIYENTELNYQLLEKIEQVQSGNSHESITAGQLIVSLPYFSPFAKQVNEIRKIDRAELEQKAATNRAADLAWKFNRQAGIDYAVKYAVWPNVGPWDYISYLRGGDCTNFASQILFNGGYTIEQSFYNDPRGWWHTTDVFGHYYGSSWINANEFCSYWFGMDYQHDWLKDFSGNIQAGDFIAYDQYHDGSWDHVGFVTATGTWDWYYNASGKAQYYRDFVVAQHTKDYCDWVSSSVNGWDDLEFENDIYYGRLWMR